MRKMWKAFKGGGGAGGSPEPKKQEQQLRTDSSYIGRDAPSLQENTTCTSDPTCGFREHMNSPITIPIRVSSNDRPRPPAVVEQQQAQQNEQPLQQVACANDTGYRVSSTTARVPPPPAPPSSPVNHIPPNVNPNYDLSTTHSVGYSGSVQHEFKSETIVSSQVANEMARSLVKKFIADIWNRGQIDLIPEVCSPNLRFNGNAGFDKIGHDGLARMVATIRDALDEYHCEIHSMVVENNKAFCRLRFTGKHTGHLLGFAPTGKVVAWMGATEFTIQNSKILKVWELGDVKSLEEQLHPNNPSSCQLEEDLEEDEI